jgi:hypothetical protein
VIGIRKRQCPSVAKNAHRLVERYAVFRQIACGLLIIPFKLEHAKYPKGLTLAMTSTQELLRSSHLLLGVCVDQPVRPQLRQLAHET